MIAYRVVPKPFIADGVVFGPGRYNFGYRAYDWWIIGNTIDDDPAVPAGHSERIGIDGIAVAYDRLNTWTQNHG